MKSVVLQLGIGNTMTKSTKFSLKIAIAVFLLTELSLTTDAKSLRHINVPPEQQGSADAYESDIMLSPGDFSDIKSIGRVRRKAVHKASKLWPGGILHYDLSHISDSQMKSKVMAAIRHWEEKTCLRFKPATGTEDRVVFMLSASCKSFIGRHGGVQEIEVNEECLNELGSIAHEIGHAAGFYHEHSRPDRDNHINVRMTNVQPGREIDFDKYGEKVVNDIEPYDVSSVMHYGLTFFSKDQVSHTLDPKDEKLQQWLGQRKGLSFLDVKTANELYNCANKCSGNTICKNEGYIGPNCACLCPDGLTGRDCTDVVQGTTSCGGVLTASHGTISTPGYPGAKYDTNTECNWLIQGRKGSQITVTFDDFEVEYDSQQCAWDFVEVRTYGPHLAGQRYCGENKQQKYYPRDPITYTGEGLFIRLHSDDADNFKGFRATYTVQ